MSSPTPAFRNPALHKHLALPTRCDGQYRADALRSKDGGEGAAAVRDLTPPVYEWISSVRAICLILFTHHVHTTLCPAGTAVSGTSS